MIRIELSATRQAELELLFGPTKDRKLRDRLQMVLRAFRGRPRHQIATDLVVSRRTVTRCLQTFVVEGVEGLPPGKAPGAKAKIPDSLTQEILDWVKAGPVACGLDRANWTQQELADHLYQTHGIRVSRAALGRFCRKVGIRLYRPTYRYLRADPQQQAQARAEQADLKKRRSKGK